jgi:hypothetical protein
MLRFKLGEKFPLAVCPSCFHILQALSDSFLFIRSGGDVEQALISLGVPYDGCCLSVSL